MTLTLVQKKPPLPQAVALRTFFSGVEDDARLLSLWQLLSDYGGRKWPQLPEGVSAWEPLAGLPYPTFVDAYEAFALDLEDSAPRERCAAVRLVFSNLDTNEEAALVVRQLEKGDLPGDRYPLWRPFSHFSAEEALTVIQKVADDAALSRLV